VTTQWQRTLDRVIESATRAKSRYQVELIECKHRLADETLSIAFGGHGKAGKSTLLNVLIGRPLLPTGILPDTGVPCALARGDKEDLEVFWPHGSERHELSTERIRHFSRIVTDEGQRRDGELTARKIQATAPWISLPPGVQWIDAPGYNDSPEMDECLRATARASDLLVWVLNSQQMLSTVESDFLAQFMAERGACAVLCFVVNVFLPQETEEGWRLYQDRFQRRVQQKLVDHAAAMGFASGELPEVLSVSARAQNEHPENPVFGGATVRKALLGIGSVRHPLCLLSRVTRCKITLQAARTFHEEELKRLLECVRKRELAAEKKNRELRERCDAVVTEVESAFTKFWLCWPRVEAAVLSKAAAVDFDTDERSQESALEEAFAAAMSSRLDILCSVLRKLERQHNSSAKSRDTVARYLSGIELDATLPRKPRLPTVEAPHAGKVVGAGLGLFLGPLGVAIGTTLGSKLDANRHREARAAAARVKSEWVSKSEARVQVELDDARTRIERNFRLIIAAIRKCWLPVGELELDQEMEAEIKAARGLISVLRAAEREFEVRLWRVCVPAWKEARKVAIAGSFNGWDVGSDALERTSEGSWMRELVLPLGEHSYKFCVDGQWHLDPGGAPTRRESGYINNVVSLS
jgi:hypothetical protein